MESKPKMAGMGVAGGGDTRISANNALKDWLAANGVWVSESSGWGTGPHPLSVAVDTMDESENESAGRGMVCNREIKEGDELFSIPMELLLTKETAKAVRRRRKEGKARAPSSV